METRINPFDCDSSLFISPQELGTRLELASAPLLLDVRPQARFDAGTRMLAGAQRCSPQDLPALATKLLAKNLHQHIVVYCVYGHQVSIGAAALLRAAGLNACVLAGGFECGEEGVDSAEDIARWRSSALRTVTKGSA